MAGPGFGTRFSAAIVAIVPPSLGDEEKAAYLSGVWLGMELARRHPEWAQAARELLWAAGVDFETKSTIIDAIVTALPVSKEPAA